VPRLRKATFARAVELRGHDVTKNVERWRRRHHDSIFPSANDDFGLCHRSAARPQVLSASQQRHQGNKRLAWSALRAFCILNGRDLTYTVDEAETFVLAAAAGDIDVPEIATWISDHFTTA
jgi:hypothetical protein